MHEHFQQHEKSSYICSYSLPVVRISQLTLVPHIMSHLFGAFKSKMQTGCLVSNHSSVQFPRQGRHPTHHAALQVRKSVWIHCVGLWPHSGLLTVPIHLWHFPWTHVAFSCHTSSDSLRAASLPFPWHLYLWQVKRTGLTCVEWLNLICTSFVMTRLGHEPSRISEGWHSTQHLTDTGRCASTLETVSAITNEVGIL